VETPTIQKQQFKNESGGWIGVVVINAKGEDTGASVEPGGTVWLSEQEQILTANAPRKAEDNPFLPHTFQRVNPTTSEIEDYTVTPLVPISENRYVPAGDRPIPGVVDSATASAQAAADARADEPVQSRVEDPLAARIEQVDELGDKARPGEVPAPPPRAAAAAAAATPVEEPATPAAAPEPGAEVAQAAPSPVEPPEETGAATPPTSDAPVGEFAAHEEVGTPTGNTEATADPEQAKEEGADLPTQVEGTVAAGPPAPWSPGSESPEESAEAGRVPPPDPSGE
jgi:hypothetical protein